MYFFTVLLGSILNKVWLFSTDKCFFKGYNSTSWGSSLSFWKETSILDESPSKIEPKLSSEGFIMTKSLVILNLMWKVTGRTCSLILISKGIM